MDTTIDRGTTATTTRSATRMELYTPIHKALRAAMGHTLEVVGRADPADAEDVARALDAVRALLHTCAHHLENENRFVHPAMESRLPGSSAGTAEDHVGHEQAFDEVEAQMREVERTSGERRGAAMLALYRKLARFVADNYEHMHEEETHNQQILWATYSDEELLAIEGAIVGSIPPQDMQALLPWMLRGNAHADRVTILSGVRDNAPPEVFQGMLAAARATLDARDWSKLARALAVPEGSGTVERW